MAVFKKRKVASTEQTKRKIEEDEDSKQSDESNLQVAQKKQRLKGSLTVESQTSKPNEEATNTNSSIHSTELTKNDDHTVAVNKEEPQSKPVAKFGPVKAPPSNIRSTTVIDYQPDVCKDYKQTGYCGYGDTCKFLHAREDYAAGWKLDKEWEEEQERQKNGDKTSARKEEPKEEEIPHKCVLCKKDYTNPIQTTCGHYFCEACFMKRYRKRPNCFICGKDTNGIIKPAKKLNEMIAQREKSAK